MARGRCTGEHGRGRPIFASSAPPTNNVDAAQSVPNQLPPIAVTHFATTSQATIPIEIAGASTSESATAPAGNSSMTEIIVYEGRLIPGHTTSDRMTKIFKTMIYQNGIEWKTLPESYPKRFFEEFKKYFRWDPLIDIAVEETFYQQAQERYGYMVHNFKKEWETKRKQPDCMPDEIWPHWLAHWDQASILGPA